MLAVARRVVLLAALAASPAVLAAVRCADNPAGGPTMVTLRATSAASDIDVGWRGDWHNLRVTSGAALKLCLTDCDAAADTTCTASGTTGPDALNAETFGSPWPAQVGTAPLCIVHTLDAGTVTGTADYVSGAIDVGVVPLTTRVYATACPQCVNGTCDGGANGGATCSVATTVRVPLGGGQMATYALSPVCVPGASPVATLHEPLRLTTGASDKLNFGTCRDLPQGPCAVAPHADACSGTCSATCTDTACVTHANGECIDAKGGIAQACCTDDTKQPCFPLESTPVQRTGSAAAPAPHPQPADATVMVADETLVGTFCAPATGACDLDTAAGLPGPGAVTLPIRSQWTGYLTPGVTTTTSSGSTSTTRPRNTTTTTTTRPGQTTTTRPPISTTTTIPAVRGGGSATIALLGTSKNRAPRIAVTCTIDSGLRGTCRASATATVDGAVVAVTPRVQRRVGLSGHARVVLRLNRRGRRALLAAKHLIVTTRVRVSEAAGATTDVEGTVTITR